MAHTTLVCESSRHDEQTSNTPKIIQETSGNPDSLRRDSSLEQKAVTYCLVLVMENLVNQNLSQVAQDINMASKTEDCENFKVHLLKLERVRQIIGWEPLKWLGKREKAKLVRKL